MSKLTAKQQLFCSEYLKDLNATEAAKRAGYSPKTAYSIGHENLKKPEIAAEISARRDELLESNQVDTANVISEISKIAFANMLDYIRVTSAGDPYIDLSQLTRAQAAAIAEVTTEDFIVGRGDDARDVRKVRIKLVSKADALEKLCKYLRLFVQDHNVTGELMISELVDRIVDPMSPEERAKNGGGD